MKNPSNILLAFYGDDFTGSTDALESISMAGARAVLFTEPPTREQIDKIPGLQVYGIAGKTRSLSAEAMEEVLLPAFQQMKSIGARHIHYKNCSTFDSSPRIGSIGKAMDTGAAVFGAVMIPVIGGTPSLGRYCVFGNLFAQMGTGTDSAVYRLDRHPSMRHHPVTPADESDLRIYLSRQTAQRIGLVSLTDLQAGIEAIQAAVDRLLLEGYQSVLFDALTIGDLKRTGAFLDAFAADSEDILFSVGSSGLETALGRYWQDEGILQTDVHWKTPQEVKPLLVISGSCSPVTAAQIQQALANGFKELILDPSLLTDNETGLVSIKEEAISMLQQQQHLIIHTGNRLSNGVSAALLGKALGSMALEAVERLSLQRVIIAGGDTSSYAARAMQIDAVEMIAPLGKGAPLCRAYSSNAAIEGLEVNFKGGQVGDENYFIHAVNGTVR